MKKYIFLLLTFLFIACQWLIAQSPEYGLYLQTYPLLGSEYTSMALDGGNPIETKNKKITLDFDLWTRNDNVFGTIFRLITDKGRNIDLMYSVGENDRRFPMLVVGDSIYPVSQEIERNVWTSVSLSIQPANGQIVLNYGKSLIQLTDADTKGVRNLRISFGYCPFEGYGLVDVASVNLKDVGLSRDDKPVRLWKMALHHGENCYDELAGSPATGRNTRWVIDQYITWNPVHSQDFLQSPSIAFDPTGGTFYMAIDKKELYVFHPQERVEDTLKIKGGEYAANYPNQLIYIPQQRELLSYSLDENLFSAFDPDKQVWKNNRRPSKDHDYWNNTLVYYPRNASLVSFGGYGHYHFNNELLISYPYDTQAVQQRVNLQSIHPRYSASSAIVDSTLYIFGGRGCPSGKQELSPRNYYDLYAVNLLTFSVTRLWEAPQTPEGGDFHPGENMIYDKENKCFYLFTTQQGGTLMKIDLQHPRFEPMSLPIQAERAAQYLYTNLYYAPNAAKLYAAIQQTQVSGKTHIDIYEINYPPIPVKSLEQTIANIPGKTGLSTGKVMVVVIVVILLVFSLFIVYYRICGGGGVYPLYKKEKGLWSRNLLPEMS